MAAVAAVAGLVQQQRLASSPPFPVKVLLGRLLGQRQRNTWESHLPGRFQADWARSEVMETICEAKSVCQSSSDEKVVMPQGSCVTGRVWELSSCAEGSREVQAFMDEAEEHDLLSMAQELSSHVWDAMRCPHANHVMQKLVTRLRPSHNQFIIEALEREGLFIQAARHKYGCRILQRLIEHCPSEQVEHLADVVVNQVLNIACHPYGNHVIGCLFEHGTETNKTALSKTVQDYIQVLGSDPHGMGVISHAMMFASEDDRLAIARSSLNMPSVLPSMACSRHGHPAVQQILTMLDGEEHQKARAIILAEEAQLVASRYGRIVLAGKERR
mmetsp:Transcript_31681/g.57707  ORF Transcript_31681/g.57707 Transcript_31681/m.57707 type:complete len:329 (-) Transcript_31681:484-1470(-)